MTMINTPAQFERFHLVVLRSHLRLHKAGMKHSRMPLRDILAKVTSVTGNKYTHRNLDAAISDLDAKLN